MMHISLNWDNDIEKTILRLTMHDGWTWDDMFQINPVSLMLMRDADHTVYMLVDMTQTRDLPSGVMAYAADLLPKFPPNLGLVLVVTQQALAQGMVNVLRSVFPDDMAAKVQAVASF